MEQALVRPRAPPRPLQSSQDTDSDLTSCAYRAAEGLAERGDGNATVTRPHGASHKGRRETRLHLVGLLIYGLIVSIDTATLDSRCAKPPLLCNSNTSPRAEKVEKPA